MEVMVGVEEVGFVEEEGWLGTLMELRSSVMVCVYMQVRQREKKSPKKLGITNRISTQGRSIAPLFVRLRNTR
jgi:hypothetical protein